MEFSIFENEINACDVHFYVVKNYNKDTLQEVTRNE